MTGVEFDPLRCKHEVNMFFVFVAPEFENFSKVELADYFVCGYQSVHICFKTELGVDTFLIEFDFNERIGVGSDDEVNFSPIDHNNFLDIINNIWQLSFVYLIHAPVILSWFEISVKNFVLV